MMTVTVLYFGELREQLNLTTESVRMGRDPLSIEDLIALLIERGDPWSSALGSDEPLRIAINQEMAHRKSMITHQAEVAFFRPVTGG